MRRAWNSPLMSVGEENIERQQISMERCLELHTQDLSTLTATYQEFESAMTSVFSSWPFFKVAVTYLATIGVGLVISMYYTFLGYDCIDVDVDFGVEVLDIARAARSDPEAFTENYIDRSLQGEIYISH
jgi:hypothetical protein